ncbi:MAG: hypothetical protein ABI595_07450 [Actinomycetota bacterium]
MHAMTVLGPIDVEELGIVMMHEHLLHDQHGDPCWFEPMSGEEGERIADGPVTMEMLGILRRSPFSVRANTRLERSDPMVEELGRFRAAGGGAIVELTSRGLQPDPEGLAEISRVSGVPVIAGCGYYVDHVIGDVDGKTPEVLAEDIIADLHEGIAGTDIQAGIIGEVGTSPQITPREVASLRAAGMASAATGAAVMVHLGMTGEQAFRAFDLLTSEGASPDRIVMNHMDEADDSDYSRRVLDLGCLIEFDTFGSEWYYDSWKTWEPRDTDRVTQLVGLCRDGFADRVTIAQDVFYKQNLRAYGGHGFEHILRNIVPMLRDEGVTDAQIHTILEDTPKRLLGLDGQDGA